MAPGSGRESGGAALGEKLGAWVGGRRVVCGGRTSPLPARPNVLAIPVPDLSWAGHVKLVYLKLMFFWKGPTVHNSESFLGANGQLPVAPFLMPVKSRLRDFAILSLITSTQV